MPMIPMLRRGLIRKHCRSLSSSPTGRTVRCLSSSDNGGIMDMLNRFRWKAAENVASTLNEEERREMLGKLDAGLADGSESEQTMKKTLGEAVAAARIEEAQKFTHKWETEKQKLMKEAEEAARARIESDFIVQQRRVAMEKWQKELEEAKAQEENPDHPLLGRVIENFGYKKLYSVSSKVLSTIPVWKKQRIYRHDRAKVIKADKLKTAHLGLPGTICLHEDAGGELSIIDGQHRVGAMTLLAEEGDFNGFDLGNILVELYTSTADTSTAEELFSEINKAEPIKLVDMPGVAKQGERQILTDGANQLADQFPEMFKPSQRCRAPHLNIDNLRDALFAAGVLKRHDIKSAKALVDWMMTQNEELAKHFGEEQNASKVGGTALKKAQKFGFYLGLDSSWFYK